MNKGSSYRIGLADASLAIKTFPANGTDEFKTFADFKKEMLKVCETCRDKDYARGVKAAFES